MCRPARLPAARARALSAALTYIAPRMAADVAQEIRFTRVGAHSVAFATAGSGPPLLVPGSWIGHLELDWSLPGVPEFITALAGAHTVIRYDRLGIGLSDREVTHDDRLASARELATVRAILGELQIAGPIDVLGISASGATGVALAASEPALVHRMVLFGAAANGEDIASPELRGALLATVRAHWGAGSRALSDIWLPDADWSLREAFTTLQREAATPEAAAAGLAAIYATDVRPLLPAVRAPTLVLHRRDDRAIPFSQGREIARLLPGARLVALDGAMHPPWLGDRTAVQREIAAFLGPAPSASGDREPAAPPAGATGDTLSPRKQEVLRLVAEGLNDGEIAERLVVSPHTVHRHVANIRTKLRQPSRAAAAAHAARHGMI